MSGPVGALRGLPSIGEETSRPMFPNARHAYLHRFTLAFLIVAALMFLLWLLNRPFYAGSRIASIGSWRLEHGRLTLNWGRPSTES